MNSATAVSIEARGFDYVDRFASFFLFSFCSTLLATKSDKLPFLTDIALTVSVVKFFLKMIDIVLLTLRVLSEVLQPFMDQTNKLCIHFDTFHHCI